MPYALPKDRDRILSHISGYWQDQAVPERALRQFSAVYDSVFERTGEVSRAIAGAKAAAKRLAEGEITAARSADLLAGCMTPPALAQLENAARSCGCGRSHAGFVEALSMSRRASMGQLAYAKRRVNIKANVALVWKMIAKDIYRNHDKLVLSLREMWQNSRDAGARNLEISWKPSGKDDGLGTLVFADDGKGMSAELFDTVFMEIGGSQKESGALGGFGAAKAAILGASNTWNWEIRSRNWVAVSDPETGSSELEERDDLRTKGVTIILHDVSDNVLRSQLGSGPPEARILRFIACSNLRGMNVFYNGHAVESIFSGLRGKREREFEDYGWGQGVSCEIRSYPRPDEDENGSVYVRFGGILQFGYDRAMGVAYKRDYVIDIDLTDPSITPGKRNYPFTSGRDAFNYDSVAFSSYQKMVDLLNKKGVSKSKELGPYETVAPGATDKREIEAEQKFTEVLSTVLQDEDFQKIFSDLGKVTREFYEGYQNRKGRKSFGFTLNKEDEGGEPSPFEGKGLGLGGTPPEEGAPTELPANPYAIWESFEAASDEDLVPAIRGWLQSVFGTLSWQTDYSLDYLSKGIGTQVDLERIADLLKEALNQNAEAASDLAALSALSRVIARLAKISDIEPAETKKTLAELNPFGGAAIIKFSNERYNTVDEHGNVDRTRSKAFRRSGAKKYMKHLVLWDFVCRQVLGAITKSARGEMAQLKLAGVGFVLDDMVNGLTSREGGKTYVMINPETFDAVLQDNKDKPWVIANFIHGLACHELSHATRMQIKDDPDHNEDWSILREDTAKGTSWLLPAIAAAARKIFRGIRIWTGRGGSGGGKEGVWSVATLKKLDELRQELESTKQELERTALDLRTEVESNEHNRKLYQGISAKYRELQRQYDDLSSESATWAEKQQQAVETIERLNALVQEGTARTEETRALFRERSMPLIHRLEALSKLQDFRDWLRANPDAVHPLGISFDRFMEILNEPGVMLEIITSPGS